MNPKRHLPASAYFSPEGLAVLVAAVVTAAVASLPLVLVPGVVAYVLLTLLRYTRWKDGLEAAAKGPYLPSFDGIFAHHANRLKRLVQLEYQVLGEIQAADAVARPLLEPHGDRVRDLLRAAEELVRKLQRVEQHVQAETPAMLGQQLAELEARLGRTEDAVARERLESALGQQRTKMDLHRELCRRAERLDAQLTSVQLTLETVLAQIARIKSAESSAASHENARVAETLRVLSSEVDAVAETVEEVADENFTLRR
jgi:hypothetical protein